MKSQEKGVDETTQLSVYYDGACPLCRREIGWYQTKRGAEKITWLDISESREDTVAEGLCKVDALERFHVKKTDGTIASGAAAFAEVWLCLPQFRLLGVVAKIPVISLLAEQMYRLFLKFRPSIQRWFKRN